MQFQVPQFIDIAPKIIGPLTLKQFLILVGAAVPVFIFFFFLNFFLWIVLSAIIVAVGVTLAFFKFNGQPFSKMLFAAFNYFWQPRFYLWRRVEAPIKMPKMPAQASATPLKDLLLKLTTTTKPIAEREAPSRTLSIFNISRDPFESLRKTTGERETARRVDYR